MPRASVRQQTLEFVRQKIELNIALASSSSDSGDDSLTSFKCGGLCPSKGNEGFDSYLESSTYSKANADSMDMEANPRDLFELYSILENTRYHVEQPITFKSKDFAISYFNNLQDKMFRQMVWMDKPSFFHLVSLIENNPIFHN